MMHIEIRKGLRKLDFEPKTPVSEDGGTRVKVEFEVGSQLAEGQLVSINLGLHNGVMRELKGRPVLISPPRAKQAAYLYRLEGEVA
jgi:hypothetical protein